MYWLLILFAFPLFGSVVYFFAIYLPALRQSRGARVATRALTNWSTRTARCGKRAAISTARPRWPTACGWRPPCWRRASRRKRCSTTGGRQRPLRQRSGTAARAGRAQFATQDSAGAVATLERLFAANPLPRQQADPALLYARALAAQGAAGTRAAFEAALTCASDAAARCLFADWLAQQPDAADRERARTLYADIVHDARHWRAMRASTIASGWSAPARRRSGPERRAFSR